MNWRLLLEENKSRKIKRARTGYVTVCIMHKMYADILHSAKNTLKYRHLMH